MGWKNKETQRIYQNKWYAQNKDKRREQIRLNVSKRRRRLQDKIIEYLKEHPCIDCHEKDVQVLEFDHLRDKYRSIANLLTRIVSWELIQSEIKKCEVVCANCHRRRTYKRNASYRSLI